MPVSDWVYPTVVTGSGWTFDLTSLVVSVGYNGGSFNDGNLVRHASAGPSNRLIMSAFKDSAGTALALPAGAIPEGMEVELEPWALTAFVAEQFAYMGVFTSKDALVVTGTERETPNLTVVGETPVAVTLGGPNDMWGGPWSDVEAEAFALFMGSGTSSTDSPAAGRAADYVRARWYYSEAATIVPSILGDHDHIPNKGIIKHVTEVFKA